ncbi:MAG: MFS transporter, partial [Pirellulaceae bacterium]|nr:MFS transporter [Pirellulaceae bacterium]
APDRRMPSDLIPPAPSPNTPSPPALRLRHYGVVIIGFAALSTFMSAPGQTHSMASFVDPMVEELGIPQTSYSLAYLIATALAALTYSLQGRIIDRHGARSLMSFAAAALGGACCLMSAVPADFIFLLYIGMFLVRLLGQGTMYLVSTWLVGEWFEKRRGLAMGLVGMGGSASVMVAAGFNNTMIEMHGWRQAWLVLAAILWLTTVLPPLLFVRNRPEEIGLLPDLRRPGDPEVQHTRRPDQQLSAEITRDSWTVREAMHHPTFWKLIAGMSTWAMIGTGLAFYQAGLLKPVGVPRTYALWLFAVQAVSATISSLVAGYYTGRIATRYLLCISVSGLALAVLLLLTMQSPWLAVIYSMLLGVNGGILRSTGAVVWVNYFGRRHQGAITGTAMSISAIASAFGPLPLALAYDHLGSHQAALICYLILPVVSAAIIFTARPPQK